MKFLRLATLVLAALLASCGPKHREPTNAEVGAQIAEDLRAHVEAQNPGAAVGAIRVTFIPVPEDVFVSMGVAAAGWAKGSISSRSIGVYQPDNASPNFRRMVEGVTQRYAFRPITRNDYQVVCGGNAPSRSSITSASAKCSMKYVDAVMFFNSIRMTRDSGYVGAGFARVPTGADKSETTHYCITLARKGTGWEARRSERVVDPDRCPRGWG